MSKELKPCPFCGETRLTIEDNQKVQDVHVLCKDCGAKTSFDGIRYDVVGRWNVRPVERALQKRVEVLKATQNAVLVNRLYEQKHYNAEAVKRIEELEAENGRLREALKEIEDFANENYEKRFPSPSCVTFETIKRYAEKALKGAGE